MIRTKPLIVTRPDKAELWHQPGFEPREREDIWPLLIALGLAAVMGAVKILGRIGL